MEKQDITIESVPLSGVIHVFDLNTKRIIFKGTEDTLPKAVKLQKPLRIYCVDDVIIIDIRYQKVYYDTEAHWYYYESFFRSQYDEYTDDEKHELYNDSFDEFMSDTLKYEPIEELKMEVQ